MALAGLIAAARPAPVDAALSAGPFPPAGLTVDALVSPVGIDATPAFAWQVDDDRRGARQSAYRIVVRGATGTVWDSGRVASSEQAFVAYRGPALAPDTRYSWTVQTWSSDGRRSPVSAPQSFDTGLHDADWRAQWIRRTTTDPVDQADDYTYARREVRLASSPISRAIAYVSADHQFQLFVNGARVAAGEAFSYPDAQYYQAIDVAPVLRAGVANAVGGLTHWYGLGKGRPEGASGLIVQLHVEHADGQQETP